MKPHLKLAVIGNRPVTIEVPRANESRIEAARRKFGGKFCHEPGSTWRPRTVSVLNEWLAKRTQEKA